MKFSWFSTIYFILTLLHSQHAPPVFPDLELTNFIKPPLHLESKFKWGFVIGSVNGLICFSYKSDRDDDYALRIWNPSLSAMLTLPPSCSPSTAYPFVLGFGYDPKTDDYKVLKLTSISGSALPEVYSLRKGSWESISQTFQSHITIHGGCTSQVCVDDHLHWLGYHCYGYKLETIVTFDFGEEAFSEIPLPNSLLHHLEDRLNVLEVLGGKLCVMSRVRDGGECEVWVMDEYGVAESCVKHHVFSQFSRDMVPYGFTSHGEFLFQVDRDDDRFGLYDPVAAKTKTFKITSRNSSEMKFVEYVDSLVWVPSPNREIKVKRESKKRKQDICGMVKRSK